MTELLAILIPGALVIGLPFTIAKLLKIRLFTKDDGYTAGWVDGFILGEDEDT
jgi:hypothetical protein